MSIIVLGMTHSLMIYLTSRIFWPQPRHVDRPDRAYSVHSSYVGTRPVPHFSFINCWSSQRSESKLPTSLASGISILRQLKKQSTWYHFGIYHMYKHHNYKQIIFLFERHTFPSKFGACNIKSGWMFNKQTVSYLNHFGHTQFIFLYSFTALITRWSWRLGIFCFKVEGSSSHELSRGELPVIAGSRFWKSRARFL